VVLELAFVAGVTISTDDVFCSEDAEVTIYSDVTNNEYLYAWYHNDGGLIVGAGPSITVTEKGSYYLEVTYNGCTIRSNVLELVPYDMTQVVINVEPTMELPEGTSITVTASGAEKYEWYRGEELISTEALLEITEPGSYSVTATVGECSVTKQFIVVIVENVLIAIPNAITPNNDGVNDQWSLPLKYLNDTTEVVIYAPDGAIVFRAMHYKNNWPESDFTFSLKNPVYYYTIMEDDKITRRGSITLVR
jgi:gliding motility-associated-like protein